jgi:hypothetical protein
MKHLLSSLKPTTIGLASAAAALTSLPLLITLNQQQNNKKSYYPTSFVLTEQATHQEPSNKRYAGAFLLQNSKKEFLQSFPPRHEDIICHHMTVSYDPDEEKLSKIASALTRPVDLKALAIARDQFCETALVSVELLTPDDDGGIPIPAENKFTHITISLRDQNDPQHGAFYSNELLERIMEKTNQQLIDYDDGKGTTMMVLKHPFRLEAVFCVDDLWNENENRCGGEKECGFCRFMKVGPCGKQFEAWEKCIDDCKDNGKEDQFIDLCSKQTLGLKDCVDAHPKYYYSVVEGAGSNSDDSSHSSNNKAETSTLTGSGN